MLLECLASLVDYYWCVTLLNELSIQILEIEEFEIFDRWGNKVFDSKNSLWGNYDACWDGRFDSELVQNGVYVYYIKVIRLDGRRICKYGDITIVR